MSSLRTRAASLAPPGARAGGRLAFAALLLGLAALSGCDRPAPSPSAADRARLAHGVVTPQIVDIRSPVSGTVTEPLVQPGMAVAAGQQLIVLENEAIGHRLQILRDKRRELERLIAAAGKKSSTLKIRTVGAPSSALGDDGRTAAMERRLADLEFLYRQGAATREELESMRQRFAAAKEEGAAPRGPTIMVEDNGDRDRLILQLDDIEGEIIALLQQQDKLRILAPSAGTVVTVDLHAGEEAFPGDRLVSLALAAPPTVVAFAEPEQVAGVAAGQELAARLADGQKTRLLVTRLFPSGGEGRPKVALTAVFAPGAPLPENPLGSAITVDLGD